MTIISLSLSLFISLSIYPSISLSLSLSIHSHQANIYLSIHQSNIYLSIYIFISSSLPPSSKLIPRFADKAFADILKMDTPANTQTRISPLASLKMSYFVPYSVRPSVNLSVRRLYNRNHLVSNAPLSAKSIKSLKKFKNQCPLIFNF